MKNRAAATSEPIEWSAAQFATDVEYYLALTPRQLPSRYLYDALGSALFEAICRLPWYRITRAEMRLLTEHGHEIFARVPRLSTLVELGSGSGEKLAVLIEAGRPDEALVDAHLIDVSSAALDTATRALTALGGVRIVAHQARYEVGLEQVRAARRRPGQMLALFLGSNIGNFDPPGADAFLLAIRASLQRGDALLLGADLVKPEPELLLAYDDPLGVTAAFNRNLLVRLNRELDGDIDVGAFGHRAAWNAEQSRVEMHLVSLRRQHVRIRAASIDIEMEEGESIWTESSYKYRAEDIAGILQPVGFRPLDQWIDREAKFALTLVEAV